MTTAEGLGLLRNKGAFLDLNPTPGTFMLSLFNLRLKPIVCTPRSEILDSLAHAAEAGNLRLSVARVVPLSDAIPFVTALEAGHRLGGKGLVVMD
ncbi:hypothetical protein [Dickeya solani]|uniref:hypothetical protein n=1 Tax=Dickeya solani TaxID=1089444 RepID=UPI0003C7EBE5|nr:hypothetical protein [Dickeya solani]ANE76285.1 hypothetical protein A4U42_13660 [Dickeya solani IPO 2222]AUH08305.1 hypothetical protein BJD21_07375 [Dickeya solani D s0432-1]AUH12310.1 hypothetical protein BJJ98_07340 [Dickeya solani]MCZ0786926.1 hypothetical protein [Dickeya solani]MCZ0790498.1 hypothetical protein [Dickeya solani]